MKKIKKYTVSFLGCEPWEQVWLRQHLRGVKLNFFDQLSGDGDIEKLAESEIISGFINTPFDRQLFKRLPRLKYVTTRSTGFDHIDLKAARQAKVLVSNVPLYGANTVAEHTFALILALSRKLYESIERTKRSDFDLSGLRGFDLQDRTIGVIGTGSIGEHVVRIAHGFGMKIVLYDVRRRDTLTKKYRAQYTTLPRLLRQSDIITLHAPYNKQTHHIINQKNIKQIKPNALLINTARGGLIETKALIRALADGNLAGAGLDVLEEEGFIKEELQLLDRRASREKLSTVLQGHVLLHMPNVVVTPHNAFNSQEALERILATTTENILGFIAGRPKNVVR